MDKSLDNLIKINETQHSLAPLTSFAKEKKIVESFLKSNNIKLADNIIRHNLSYIVNLVKKYSNFNISKNDLIQEGIIGLIKALKQFDVKRDVKFISFGFYWIKSEINNYVMKNISISGISDEKKKKKLYFFLPNLMKKKALTQSEANVLSKLFNIDSLDLIRVESVMRRKDLHYDNNIENNFYDLDISEDKKTKLVMLKKLMNNLDNRSKYIIKYRWLLKDKYTLSEISKKYRISPERVRQIEQSAINFMRNSIAK